MFQSSSTQSGSRRAAGVERLLTIAGLGHGEAVRFQDAARDLAHDAAVIDDKAGPAHARASALSRQREQPGDIQDHQQPAVQPIDAAAELRPGRLQRRRIALEQRWPRGS